MARKKPSRGSRDASSSTVVSDALSSLDSDNSDTHSTKSKKKFQSKKKLDAEKEDQEEQQEEMLDQAMEDLSEKRSSTRVSALHIIQNQFLSRLLRDKMISRQDSLLSSLLSSCCRKPATEAEGVAGLQVLRLLGLTIGSSEETLSSAFVQDVFPVLETLVKHDTRSDIQALALETLATCVCFCTDDMYSIERLDRLIFSFLEKNSADSKSSRDVLIAALNAWGVIHSRETTLEFITTSMDSHMPLFMSIARSTELEHDIELCTSVSDDIMLLVTAIYETQTQVLYQDILDLLIEHYQSLVQGMSKKVKKSTRKDQRQLGREYIHVLTDTTYRCVTEFQVGEEVLAFEGWSRRMQIRHLKGALLSGFQDFFQYSGEMRFFFDLSRPDEVGDPFEEVTRVAHAKTSPYQKRKDADLRKERLRRNQQKHAFLDEE